MIYSPSPRHLYAHLTNAEQLARINHEAYERHAAEEFGYIPRSWDNLLEADRRLRIAVARELLDRNVVGILPDCNHDETALVLIEARKCLRCGSFPRLCRYTEEL